MLKLMNRQGCAFDAFDQVVGRFGGGVGDAGDMPVGDLSELTVDRHERGVGVGRARSRASRCCVSSIQWRPLDFGDRHS